jgi:hypothetical protein
MEPLRVAFLGPLASFSHQVSSLLPSNIPLAYQY